eukprot:CAMPEP_0171336786 /NCGR_PEP_ID=MMETSP0878-20121228/6256_1 /TAXON_ID=67004 /ORGANISM="Thalassiosira weissflogii, Strain CCMP1336" /LENGTH=468 /DNA_ID=CAMNT_0011838309 /DNA_START=235 /DNA_END=1641 /DNA_ORIENTATION=-
MSNKSTQQIASTKTLYRRTSSLAYDAQSRSSERFHNQPNQQRIKDEWRERWNLPPTTVSASRSVLASTIHENETASALENVKSKPIYTFGIITDIQYAPIPDGHSYNGTPRYYRHALIAAEHAARHFEDEKVHCVVGLGDIVDGKCADVERWGGNLGEFRKDGDAKRELDESEREKINYRVGHDAMDDVVKALSSYKNGKILHTYGNHELYCLSRIDLKEKLRIPFTTEPTGDLVGYYTHSLHEYDKEKTSQSQEIIDSEQMKLRFLFIDSYDISLLDRCPQTSPKRQLAHKLLSANNHNYPNNENSPEGLGEFEKRFVAFNGGVDKPQLEWLEKSLQSAKENNEKVIIFSHQPIHPGSSGPICLIWNYDHVLTILRKYSDVVIASFSGHAHKGGYVRDAESGIHFRTLEAVLESPDPIRTYGIVDVWEDQLKVRGWGNCMSDIYDFDHLFFSKKKSSHPEGSLTTYY